LPLLLVIISLTNGGVQLLDEVLIISRDRPVEEIGGDSVAAVIFGARKIAFGDLRAVELRLIEIPADVVGDTLLQPAPGASGVGFVAPPPPILLDHMDDLVEHSAKRLALEIGAKPSRRAADARAASRGHTTRVGANHDAEAARRFKTFARQHLDQFGIPF